MKNNIMVMAELMITPFQLLVVALGQLFNMLLGAFGIDATKEIGGLVASLVGGMEMVKQGAIGIMSGLVDLTTSSIISGIENMYAPIAEEFANAGVEMETQLTPIQTLLSGFKREIEIRQVVEKCGYCNKKRAGVYDSSGCFYQKDFAIIENYFNNKSIEDKKLLP